MATKPADGKFSLSYFLNGEGKKDWLRSYGDAFRVGGTLLLIFCIGFTVYTMFFPKSQGNVNKPEGHQTIVNTPFSKTGAISQSFSSVSTQKVEEKKRSWWIPHLYSGVSAGGRLRSEGSSLSFNKMEPEVRIDVIGLRWDWN